MNQALRCFCLKVTIGISEEFLQASAAAEVIGLACVFEVVPGGGRIHVHAANRIFRFGCGKLLWLGHPPGAQVRRSGRLLQILFGVLLEFPGAMRTAEIISLARMLDLSFGGGWVDRHSANGVALGGLGDIDRFGHGNSLFAGRAGAFFFHRQEQMLLIDLTPMHRS